ncbi:MAG TPA: LacI family transcriptional regulator [Firmicutes bacterium]|nr:LacI family transcriptional regulator [Bacillota bacterium]
MNKITIKEVAEKANVSVSTVSRVLNNNYPVSDRVREEVLQCMKDLNYQPNGIARSLKNQKTHMIGFVVADISNPFFMQIAKAMESVISNEDNNLVFCSSDGIPHKEQRLLELLNEKRVEAIVVASSDPTGSYIKQLVEQGMPVVLIDRKIPGINTDVIVEDNFNAAYRLTEYLIKNGHQKIAIINVSLAISVGMERFDGFKEALKHYGLAMSDHYVLQGGFQRQDACAAVKKMISENENDLPTALFCSNNIMAEGAIIALRELGLKIPDDISLVSFGTKDLLELIDPKLTIAAQNTYALGSKAGQIILERLNSHSLYDYKEYVIVSEMIIRDSVKAI